jgi:citrate lyase subunit beta/citryl-CoA lyase
MLIACCAAGISAMGVIGSIATYTDIEGYRAAIAKSKRFGFQGASCIHPDIVPLLNEGFGPSAREIASARAVIEGFEKAKAAGRGSISVDGKMIDIPVIDRARNLLARHEAIERRLKR